MKVYCDTNIFLDFLENRKDKLKPLGELAFQIFKRAINCEFYIIFSNHTKKELFAYGISNKKIDEIMNLLNAKIILVKAEYQDYLNAKKFNKIHYKDAVHYIIAKRTSDILLTNDNELKILPNCVGYETF